LGSYYSDYEEVKFPWKGLGITLVVIMILAIILSNWWIPIAYGDTVTIRVNRLDREPGQRGKYLVWATLDRTGQDEVFENTDNILAGKINSSDVQGQLKVGHTYTVKVIGWRRQLTSSYRNITSIVEEVSTRSPTSVKGNDDSAAQTYCPSCGRKTSPEDKFCAGCGRPLK